jgi:hypothetical protein
MIEVFHAANDRDGWGQQHITHIPMHDEQRGYGSKPTSLLNHNILNKRASVSHVFFFSYYNM